VTQRTGSIDPQRSWGHFLTPGRPVQCTELELGPVDGPCELLHQGEAEDQLPRTRSSWHEMIDMKLDTSVTIRDRIDELYRSESRRVFASLVRLLNDFDLADDAMHEAFAAALEIWQRDGVPANPRAWLISTGKFKAIDALRRQGRLKALEPEIASRKDMRPRRALRSYGLISQARPFGRAGYFSSCFPIRRPRGSWP
jgi:Sigma-70 region 2